MKSPTRILVGFGLLCLPFAVGLPMPDGQATTDNQPLPTVVVTNPEQALYRIAVPDVGGTSGLGGQAAGVLRNDFALVSLLKVLDPASFVADLKTEGLGINPPSWQTVGAQGVIKGQISQVGG